MLAAALACAFAAQEEYRPYVAPASGEGEAALARMKWPAGFEAKLWAAEPALANPVSMCVDAHGDVYVVEDFRIKRGVEDIRDHMDWLDDDLACRTVEERVAYVQRRVGASFVADYTTASERVRWLSDTDGDGRADRDTVFADGFNSAAAGVAAGVLAWKDKVFFTCIPDLWSLSDTDGDHVADVKQVLSTGYGLRFALMGHDLHGLAIGPDGKLYFTCGDRGLSVPLADGTRLDNPFSGAVLRCDLDGSGLEVFATGLRNPQELVFDDYGELFTVDNNSDGGDKARLVHVIEGMDAGWRQAYQWITEPNLRGPWNDEDLWKPHFEGQAAYIVPPLANICDGPSGLAYNPGTALTPQWRNRFFICDFRGDAANSGIHWFTLKPKGATFELERFEHFVWGTLATDCDFGPDGNFYWSDWVEGWGTTGKGRIYRLASSETRDARQSDVGTTLRADWTSVSEANLLVALASDDQRVRFAAQFELVRRDEKPTLAKLGTRQALARIAGDRAAPKFARLHAVWGLEQLGDRCVENWVRDPDADVRAAVLHAFGTFHRHGPWAPNIHSNFAPVAAALDDPSPKVQREAALALSQGIHMFDRETIGMHARIYGMLDRIGEGDPALRRALIRVLVKLGPRAVGQLFAINKKEQDVRFSFALVDATRHPSVFARLGAVVALRGLKDAEVAGFLGDADERVVIEAARAIYDEQLAGALPALAKLIEREDLKTTALVRRVLNANFRLGGKENAEALASFATREDSGELHRWEALTLLARWTDPPGRDFFTGEWWPLPKRDGAELPTLVRRMELRGIAKAAPKLALAWIALAEKCNATMSAATLVERAQDRDADLDVRAAAIAAAAKLAPAELEPALAALASDVEPRVRAAALGAVEAASPERAYPLLEHAANEGSREERRVAYAALAKLDDARVDELLALQLEKLRAGLVPAEVALELVEAGEKRSAPAVVRALAALREPRKLDPALAPFVDSLYGGDRARGRKIFREQADAACLRCHKIEWGEGGQVGPDQRGVGKRLARLELLEALCDPNRRIAPGFESVLFTLDDERYVAGVVVSETADKLVVRNAQDELLELDAGSITGRKPDLSAMPQDIAKFLSREDVRDLIEYLANLEEQK